MMRRKNGQSFRNSPQSHSPKGCCSSFSQTPMANTHAPNSSFSKVLNRQLAPSLNVGNLLSIKREFLRRKEKPKMEAIHKEEHKKMKKKTDHFNLQFIESLKQRKQGLNWIEYNMTVGIAFLWKKIEIDMRSYKKKRNYYNNAVQNHINEIDKQFQKIIEEIKSATSPNERESLMKIFHSIDDLSQPHQALNHPSKVNLKQTPKKYSAHHQRTNCTTSLQTPNRMQSLARIKQSICKLNSCFSLLKRGITIKKEDKFIDDFLQRRKQGKLTIHDFQELETIAKINQERCELIEEMVNNVQFMQSNYAKNLINPAKLKQIQQINIAKELAEIAEHNQQEMVRKKLRNYTKIVFQVEETKQKIDKSIQSSTSPTNIFKWNNEPKKLKKKVAYRASIQQKIIKNNEIHPVIGGNHHKSAKSERSSIKSKHSNKKSDFFQEENKKKISLKKSRFIDQGLKQSKKIFFLKDANIVVKKGQKNIMKSQNCVKSKKEISWKKKETRSYTSMKSLKSLKSLGSQSSLSSKFGRSLKTEIQIRHIRGKQLKIAYSRKQRQKIFKANKINENTQNYLLNSSIQQKISISADEPIQLCPLVEPQTVEGCSHQYIVRVSQADQIKQIKLNKQASQKRQKSFISSNPSQRPLSRIDIPYLTNKDKSNGSIPVSRDVIIRDCLNRLSLVKKQNNMVKQKRQILNEIENMFKQNVISRQNYQKFKVYFEVSTNKKRSKLSKLTCIRFSQDCNTIITQKISDENIYTNLLMFRKVIQKTVDPNVMSKYYCDNRQYRNQSNQTKKSLEVLKKQQIFFNIKNVIEPRQKQVVREKITNEMRSHKIKNFKLGQKDF